MQNLSVQWLVSLVTVAVLLLCSCQAINFNQLDSLKAQFLPAEYRNANFTLDDLKRAVRQKCKKVSGIDNSTLYQDIEQSAGTFMTCISELANVTSLQEEIAQARPIGELDTVFEKYCTKAPSAEKCLLQFNSKLQPCLSVEEKNQNAIMMRLATSLLHFFCDKGGAHVALFVAEEGPECLEANKEAISHCMNSSFAELVPKDTKVEDLYNLPELVFKPEHCIDLERFEKCTVHHLEQCRELTPANVAESVFRFIKNETDCKHMLEKKGKSRTVLEQGNGSPASGPLVWLALSGLWLLLLRNFF